jgi:hypothetical protein
LTTIRSRWSTLAHTRTRADAAPAVVSSRKPPPTTCWTRPHPDKAFIGRIERGFDFLGYHFSRAGLKVAKKTIANFIEKASRLYEQKCRAVSTAPALEMYVRRWVQWANGGMIVDGAGLPL